MKKLKINRMDFELAFEQDDGDVDVYLDSETGAIVFADDYMTTQLANRLTDEETLESILATLKAQTDIPELEREAMVHIVQAEYDTTNRYRELPKRDSRDSYQDMQEFIFSMKEANIRDRLQAAIQGTGAFRRFKDALSDYPDIRESWFEFRDERERQRMLDWLESEDIEPDFE